MIPIIGLVGAAGCGKTTAAEALAPLSYRRVGFADAIKDAARAAAEAVSVEFGDAWPIMLDMALRGDRGCKDAIRPLLIGIGETGRNIDPDYWIERALASMRPDALHVVDDVRYLNECVALKRRGALLVRIYRPETPAVIYSEVQSLAAIDAANVIDYIVLNDADVATLAARIERVARARIVDLTAIERENAAGRGSGSVVVDVLTSALGGG